MAATPQKSRRRTPAKGPGQGPGKGPGKGNAVSAPLDPDAAKQRASPLRKSTNSKSASSKRIGRPPVYGPEIEAEICQRLSDGEALTDICKDSHMPGIAVVCTWGAGERPDFSKAYARAREARAERLVDEMLRMADEPSSDAAAAMDKRVRVDTRKWLAQKLFRRVYGDRVQTDVQQLDRDGNPTDPAQINIMALAADKLDTDELRVLIELYRKMGVRLPHEPEPVTIEHEGDGDE